MYSVRFYRRHGQMLVFGDRDSALAVANLLEGRRTKFKVADVRGFMLGQEALGCGGYTCWLEPDEPFPDDE